MGAENRPSLIMGGQIIADKDQLSMLCLDQTFQMGDIVDVLHDPDERYLKIRKPGKTSLFSIYRELIKIL